MNARVDLAVSIPQMFPGRSIDPRFIREHLARAEALGFHSAWVINPVFDEMEHLEQFASVIAPRL